MKRARFSDEKIFRILQEADRSPIAEVIASRGQRTLNLQLAQEVWRSRYW
jgi:hypothetical protein